MLFWYFEHSLIGIVVEVQVNFMHVLEDIWQEFVLLKCIPPGTALYPSRASWQLCFESLPLSSRTILWAVTQAPLQCFYARIVVTSDSTSSTWLSLVSSTTSEYFLVVYTRFYLFEVQTTLYAHRGATALLSIWKKVSLRSFSLVSNANDESTKASRTSKKCNSQRSFVLIFL